MKVFRLTFVLLQGFLPLPFGALAQEKSVPEAEPEAIETKSGKPPEDIVSFKIKLADDDHWIKIRLRDDAAPRHAENFRTLVGQNFYQGISVHRVVPNFLVQTGDPLTRDDSQKRLWGTGGVGYEIPAEIGLPHLRGSVGMAHLKSSPNKKSSGSQFYIMLASAPQLDKDYTVFGEVIEGLDVIDTISKARADTNDNPVARFTIDSCRLGEPGLMAAMTKPISSIPKPKMPAIPNPLSMVKNPFGGKDKGEEAVDAVPLPPSDSGGDVSSATKEDARPAEPAEPAGSAEPEKKKGIFQRLKFW